MFLIHRGNTGEGRGSIVVTRFLYLTGGPYLNMDVYYPHEANHG